MNARSFLKPEVPPGMARTSEYTVEDQIHDHVDPEASLSEEYIALLNEKLIAANELSGIERNAECFEIAKWINDGCPSQ